MSKEEFIENLCSAYRRWAPRATSGHRRTTSDTATLKMSRAALWLSEETVAGFDPSDFQDLPEPDRSDLRSAVAQFARLGRSIPTDQPANDRQYRKGKELFERITSIIRLYLLDDWKSAVEQLIFDAKRWVEKQGWQHARQKRFETAEIGPEEPLLGEYQLPQLQFVVDDDVFFLQPLARFVAGAGSLGLVELFKAAPRELREAVRVLRTQNGWHLYVEAGKRANQVRRLPWSEQAFLEAVAWLRSRA